MSYEILIPRKQFYFLVNCRFTWPWKIILVLDGRTKWPANSTPFRSLTGIPDLLWKTLTPPLFVYPTFLYSYLKKLRLL